MPITQKVGGDFGATSQRVVIPATVNPAVPGQVVILERTIPSGATAFLKMFSAKVIDINNADQVYFAICRNGIPIQSGMERIPGVQFDFMPQIDLGLFVHPGIISIVGYNITGMLTSIESNAIAGAIGIAAQAWWSGSLLSERGGS